MDAIFKIITTRLTKIENTYNVYVVLYTYIYHVLRPIHSSIITLVCRRTYTYVCGVIIAYTNTS